MPLTLTDGPLVPIDPRLLPAFGPKTTIGDWAAANAGDALDGQDARLDTLAQTITDQPGFDTLADNYDTNVGPAEDAHAAFVGALDDADPSGVLDATGGLSDTIPGQAAAYADPPPPDVPTASAPDVPPGTVTPDNPDQPPQA